MHVSELRHSALGTVNSTSARNAIVLQLLRYMTHALFCSFCNAGLHELCPCHQHHCADLQPLESLPSPLSTLSGWIAASTLSPIHPTLLKLATMMATAVFLLEGKMTFMCAPVPCCRDVPGSFDVWVSLFALAFCISLLHDAHHMRSASEDLRWAAMRPQGSCEAANIKMLQ